MYTDTTFFSPEMFRFLGELSMNNSREWFTANKDRYEKHVREPLLSFIRAFGPRLVEVSEHYVADPRPVGGSMFRIYRDVRFSKDKAPYKTAATAQFRHEVGKDVHAPGFYLHIEPGAVYLGVGMWHPDADTLARVRGAITANPARWERANATLPFASDFTIGGDSTKRAPKGIDPDHPLIEDLKRKDFIASYRFEDGGIFEPDFLDRFTWACKDSSPYMEFLTTAVGLPW